MIRRLAFGVVLVAAVAISAQPIPQQGAASFANRYSGSLPVTCKAKQVALDSSYRINVCGPDNTWTLSGGSGSGTVTSVAATVPAFMVVSGSPITTSGTLGFSFASQTQNLFLASPNGSSGAPTFRALAAADVPPLNQNTTGTAAALAANGTNCSAGNAPLGVDASGNAEGCFGVVLLQATTPGAQQTGNLNISGAGVFGGALTGSNISGTNTGDQTSVSGNAGTASASDHTPTACGANTFAQSQSTVWSFTCASVSLAALASQAANTVIANATAGSTTPTAFAMPSCSSSASALIWTTSAGFGCNSAIAANTAATLATARAINGVNFDGSAPITVTAAGSTLSDTVTVAKGGTGLTTLTANNVMLGNGTNTPQFVAPGTSGNVLTSNGTTWASSAAAASGAACSTCTSNRLQKGNGANTLQDSALAESSGTVSTTAGTPLGLTATAPAATSASQAGIGTTITASPAVDGSSTHGGAAGGYVNLTAGAAVNGGNVGQVLIVTTAPSSTSVPALAFGAANNLSQSGFGVGSGFLSVIISGGIVNQLGQAIRTNSGGQFTISSNSDPANADTRLSRCGVKCWQFGDNNDTGNTQDYILSGFNTTSGTNTAGGKLQLRGGLGTGSGAGGDVPIQTSWPGTSGTTAQTLVADRLYLRALPKTLTAATATGFADINVPSGSACGGTYTYTVEANDGTDYQAQYGTVQWSAANKAGTVTVNDNTVAGTPVNLVACACTSGTLSETVSETAGASKFTAKINATSSLITPTLRASWRVAIDGGPCTVSPL